MIEVERRLRRIPVRRRRVVPYSHQYGGMRRNSLKLGMGLGVVIRPRAELDRLTRREDQVGKGELLRYVALLAHGTTTSRRSPLTLVLPTRSRRACLHICIYLENTSYLFFLVIWKNFVRISRYDEAWLKNMKDSISQHFIEYMNTDCTVRRLGVDYAGLTCRRGNCRHGYLIGLAHAKS